MQIVSPAQRHPITIETSVPRAGGRSSSDAWRALSWIGVVFTALGLLDVALGWYPTAFGNPEWEFGTISGTLNALAIPMLGLYLVLASAIARSDRRAARAVSVTMAVLLVVVLGLGLLYLTVVPLAMTSVAGNVLVALGMKKAIVKAVALGIADSVLLGVGMLKGWRVGPAVLSAGG
jgi:hypothetical protein